MKRLRACVATLVALAALGASRVAAAEPLDDKEYAALVAGEYVGRPINVDVAGVPYFGVVSYIVVDAPADAIVAALNDPSAYKDILPRVLAAKQVGLHDGLRYVELTQGGKLGAVTYTVVIKKESRYLVRFWLDPARPHDIADCWGFYEIEPIGADRSLVHWGALLHLDFGVVKLLFSEMIRGYAMGAPALLRVYLQKRELAGAP